MAGTLLNRDQVGSKIQYGRSLTAREVGSRRPSLAAIDADLGGRNGWATLQVLTDLIRDVDIAAQLDEDNYLVRQTALVQRLIPESKQGYVQSEVERGTAVLNSINIALLMTRLGTHADWQSPGAELSKPEVQACEREMGTLALAMGAHRSKAATSADHHVGVYNTINKQWVAVNPRRLRASVAYEIADSIMNQSATSSPARAAADALEDAVGASLLDLIAVSAVVGERLYSDGAPDAVERALTTVRQDLRAAWMRAYCMPVDEFTMRATRDSLDQTLSSTSCLQIRPLMQFPDGKLRALRQLAVTQLARPEAVFDLLSRYAAEDTSSTFGKSFGKAAENYLETVLRSTELEESRVWKIEDELKYGRRDRSSCDFAVLSQSGQLLLVESVHKPVLAHNGPNHNMAWRYRTDLENAVFKKLGQIDRTLVLLKDEDRLKDVRHIVPVVVVSPGGAHTATLKHTIEQEWATKSNYYVEGNHAEILGIDARCANVGVLEPFEVQCLMRLALRLRTSLSDVVYRWLADGQHASAYSWFLTFFPPAGDLPTDVDNYGRLSSRIAQVDENPPTAG